MLREIFLEFERRVFHAPESLDVNSEDITLGEVSFRVGPSSRPYAPGHVELVYPNASDFTRIRTAEGQAVLDAIFDLSARLGKSYWIFADAGKLTGETGPVRFHILPDPWNIPSEFAEPSGDHPLYDPFTDVVMDGLRGKKFHLKYGDAHMTGFLLEHSDYHLLHRVANRMRTQFGRMRRVLWFVREKAFDNGHVPSMGYTLFVMNYGEPQAVLFPRIFIPKEGSMSAFNFLYRAEVARDLEDITAFAEMHADNAGKILDQIR